LGLLASKWETADSGRRRRIYSLTRLGVKTLRQRRDLWARFSSAIASMLERGA
jgi:DNA-binding PadR family transcriptional regulator